MSEDYWDRRRRHLNDDNKFLREQSKRDLEIFKTRVNIDRLSGEITAASGASEREGALADISRYRLMALERIDALTDFSREIRRIWHTEFDAINPWLLTADKSLEQFKTCMRARTTVLRDISSQLGTPKTLISLRLGSGFGTIADKIQSLSILDDTIRQRWVDALNGIDTTIPFIEQILMENATLAMQRVLDEIDSAAARCDNLFTALTLLHSARARYRLWC